MIPPEIEAVALLGWCVFPTARRHRATAFDGASEQATCDLDTLGRWSHDYPGCGWRAVCGPSRLFVLDVDRAGVTHAADGFEALTALATKHGAIPPRPMTRTGGSGGAALFFTHASEPLIGKSGFPAPGLDPLRGRQAVMIPPSCHPDTGRPYTWRVAPWDVHPPAIPAWLANALRPADPPPSPGWQVTSERAYSAVIRAVQAVQDAPGGQSNDVLNRRAYRLGTFVGAGVLSEADASAALLSAAMQRAIPSREAQSTIRSGITAGRRAPIGQ